jgi:hypothetical protein
MKKLVVSIIALVLFFNSFAQSIEYSRLRNYETKFLNKHKIQYASLFVRTRLSVNLNYKKSWVESYNKFIKWNDSTNCIIPDTVGIMSGNEFIQNKSSNVNLTILLQDIPCDILQYWVCPIRDKHIKNVWILEVKYDYSTYIEVSHIIVCENHDGYFYTLPITKSIKDLNVSDR